MRGKETVTRGGRKVRLYANIGSVSDVGYVLENDAAGIGLFRSEFRYLGRSDFPTEEEQFQAYRQVVQTMAGKKVIIRTLDIGADKQADYFNLGKENNPALGYRAIIFHFGSLSMTDEKSEDMTRMAVEMAKEGGALISFDPNLRPPLWGVLEKAKEKIAYGISQCHILKISDGEIEFFTGTADIDEGVARIQKEFNTPFICATMGRMGSRACFHGLCPEYGSGKWLGQDG